MATLCEVTINTPRVCFGPAAMVAAGVAARVAAAEAVAVDLALAVAVAAAVAVGAAAEAAGVVGAAVALAGGVLREAGGLNVAQAMTRPSGNNRIACRNGILIESLPACCRPANPHNDSRSEFVARLGPRAARQRLISGSHSHHWGGAVNSTCTGTALLLNALLPSSPFMPEPQSVPSCLTAMP